MGLTSKALWVPLTAADGAGGSPPAKWRHLHASLAKFATSRPAYITKPSAKKEKKSKK